MLVGSGGGTISVETAALDALSAQIANVASNTSSTRGGLGGAAGSAAGCQDPAGGSFQRLQSLLTGALACLEGCSTALNRATTSAAIAYETTDAGAL
jgi:hypothetical protein